MWLLLVIITVVVLWGVVGTSGRKSKRKSKVKPKSKSKPVSASRVCAVGTSPAEPPAPRALTAIDARGVQPPTPPRRYEASMPAPLRWHGPGATLEVSGFRLRDPCVYASEGGRSLYTSSSDPSEILVHAAVSRPRGPVLDMGYWPWYSRIEPEHRFQYLEWLAAGKAALPAQEGLLFLYYYGIERRLLIDGQDKAWCLREIARLRKLDEPRAASGAGRSFRMYSSGLLWFEVARSPELFNERAFAMVCDLTGVWNESSTVAALSWLAGKGQPLACDLAMQVARMNPHAMRSVVTKRVGDRFEELFRKRYTERFGEGIRLKVSKRPRRHTYRPASAGLSEVSCSIPDATGIPSQFKPLTEIWNGCIEDLRRLSKVVVTLDSGASAVEAWEAMPAELRADTDHPLTARLQEVVAGNDVHGGDNQGPVRLVPVSSLAAVLGLELRPRLTAGQSRRLAQTMHHAGYAVEPDAHLTGRAYGWNDPVAVFAEPDGAEIDASRYLGATCMLHLGLTVAEADGAVEPEELRHLSEHIDAAFQLPPQEKERLDALRAVLLKTGAELGAVSQRLETALPAEARRQVGRLLVAIAAASGSIERKEQAALRKCFRALALAPELLEQTIAEVAPGSDTGLVTVGGTDERQTGEPIPAPAGLTLNREAISAIMAETREVAKLLADAMAVEEEDEDDGPPIVAPPPRRVDSTDINSSPPVAPVAAGSLPPARFAAFFAALSARSSWSRDEVEELARGHRVMPDGAIEAINEWALDRWGVPVIEEDGETLTVNLTLR